LWALLTPLVLYLARRFPLEREAIFRRAAIHLLFGSLLSLLQLGVYTLAFQLLLGDSSKGCNDFGKPARPIIPFPLWKK
jgi:hypothetical protein